VKQRLGSRWIVCLKRLDGVYEAIAIALLMQAFGFWEMTENSIMISARILKRSAIVSTAMTA